MVGPVIFGCLENVGKSRIYTSSPEQFRIEELEEKYGTKRKLGNEAKIIQKSKLKDETKKNIFGREKVQI